MFLSANSFSVTLILPLGTPPNGNMKVRNVHILHTGALKEIFSLQEYNIAMYVATYGVHQRVKGRKGLQRTTCFEL